MKSCRCHIVSLVVLVTTLIATFTGLLAAGPPPPPKISAFAPADDILSQVDYYAGRLATALEEKDDYTAADQRRDKKDASTQSALLLALALHDQDHRLKASAAALVPLAQKMAGSFEDYDAAKAAHDAMADGLKNGADSGPTPSWHKVADLAQLMKQVPAINNRLTRSLKKTRFEKDAEKSAGYSAALAVIAQAAMVDAREAKDPADTDKWYQFCAEMRDAAGAINAAIHKRDFDAATVAGTRLKGICKQCHNVFRPELN